MIKLIDLDSLVQVTAKSNIGTAISSVDDVRSLNYGIYNKDN